MPELTPNVNFYEVIPDEFKKPLATYENEKLTHLELPVRVCIAGSAGTGKTQAVMNFINAMGCFNKYYLFIADVNEPLYKFLAAFVRRKLGKDAIKVFDSIADMPPVEEFKDGHKYNHLCIIDDMINEKHKDHKNAIDAYTKGRRANISIIYITQDFFKTDHTIRKNSKALILTRFDDESDLKNILLKYKGKLTLDQIRNIYEYAIAGGKQNFFMIDTEGKQEHRYRRNLAPIGEK